MAVARLRRPPRRELPHLRLGALRTLQAQASGLARRRRRPGREPWRLADTSHEQLAGLFLTERDHERELSEPAGPAGDPLQRAIAAEDHRDRVQRFATLKPRERRDLLLHAGGYSYHEIAQLTASSYCAVNRRLSESRAQLRRSA